MSAKHDVEALVAKALVDESFRAQLVGNPVETVRSAGYALSDEQLEQLLHITPEDVKTLISHVEERLSKSTINSVSTVWSP